MDAPRLEPGTILAGKYRLGPRLGEGGMGTVYRAEHLVLKADVAVKVIDREVSDGDVTLARFMREAQAAASLRSPHVVQIIDYGMEGARPFMVMELLEGETLASRIERMGQLTPLETYRVLSHVARAVGKAHEAGIVHRDLKPDNVFLVHNEGDEIAKVLDFGVAKIEEASWGGGTHTRTGSLLGTPYYMSPEQAQGNKEIDHRSDLWALGVIAFECLTGTRPFSSDGLGDLVIQICIRDIPVPSNFGVVPPGFDEWFLRAVAREPEHRFQSARELSDSLREALGLVRDGSVPESIWSPTSLPTGAISAGLASARAAAAPGGAGEASSPRSSPRVPIADPDERMTQVETGGVRSRLVSDTWSDTELPRGSQWELVPHETRPLPFPEAAPRSSVSSVVGIALLALALGGGAVFLLREAGVPIPGLEAPSATTANSGRRGTSSSRGEGSEDAAKQGGSKTAASGAIVSAEDSDERGSNPSGAVEPNGPGTPTKNTEPTSAEPSELDALDAFERANEPRPPEPTLEGDEAEGSKPPSGSEPEGAEPGSPGTAEPPPKPEGPRPELPDALKPAPPPPPTTP